MVHPRPRLSRDSARPRPAPFDCVSGAAVITGGTRGAGLAIARALGLAGHPVLLTYGRDDRGARTAIEQLRAAGVTAEALRADLAHGGIAGILDAVGERGERLGVFVHNAATYHPAPTSAATYTAFCAEAAVTLGPLIDGAARIADMMTGGPGRIVAVSSIGALRAVPYYANLGLAKAALESLVRYLAVEFAAQGITVNAVSAAKIDKSAGADMSQASLRMAKRTPAQRLTTVEDVADVVSLLCSPRAGWIHGQVISVDGGLSLVV